MVTIPNADFAIELTPANVEKHMKEIGATKTPGGGWQVPVEHIIPMEGFNLRVETKEYLDHIESIKKSIAANGFYPNKPLGAYLAKTEDGGAAIFVTDGYSRLRAVNELIAAGTEISTIPVILKPAGTSVEDITYGLILENSGLNYGPYEKALVVKRLTGYGQPIETVAQRLGITVVHARNMLTLAGASAKIRNNVIAGKISFSEAVKTIKELGTGAGEAIEEAVKEAESRGKTKATAKDVKKTKAGKKAVEKKAAKKASKSKDKAVTGHVPSATQKDGLTADVDPATGTTVLTGYFIAGKTYTADEVRPVRLISAEPWWAWVDSETKEHVVVERTARFSITVVIDPEAAPADETVDDSDL